MSVLQEMKKEDLSFIGQRKYILSYGGGVNSSALFFYLLENNYPLDLVIFADTGDESEETLRCVDNMMKECLKRNIPFQKVYSHLGDIYNYYYSKKKVPSMMKRDCTGKFKVSPIRNHIRKRFGKNQKFVMYIGIAYEELTRMKESNVLYIKNSYPFVYDKIDREGNLKILKKYNFIAYKSGCVGCIYNKKDIWEYLIRYKYEVFVKYKKLEMQNPKYPNIPVKDWIKKYSKVIYDKEEDKYKTILTKKFITLNNQYRLEDLEKQVLSQKTLNEFVDNEITCSNIIGGCYI